MSPFLGSLALMLPCFLATAAPAVTVSGTVVGPDGRPVAGATVALVVEAEAGKPPGLRTTDRLGRFSFDAPAGKFGLSATSAEHTAAYRCGLAVHPGAAPIQLALGGPGVHVTGRLRARGASALADASVGFARVSNEACDEFHARADAAGRFAVRLPAASYSIQARAVGFEASPLVRELAKDEDFDLPIDHLAASVPPPVEVVRWIHDHAIPLATARPGSGLGDLEPLRRVVGDARVVSLGEATHGTREFFQLKHRMLELLVERLGFSAFAIEATMPEAFDVDAYVQTGKGDPGKALSGLYFWTWNTEEVLDLIRWMRAYNADARHPRKLHFYGFDMQSPQRAARVVRDYLGRVSVAEARAARPALSVLASPLSLPLSPADRSRADPVVAHVAAWLDAHRAECERMTGADAFALARQHARILQQNLEMVAAQGGASSNVRDRAMADNVRWILDREGPAGRVVLWAHNGHVGTHDEYGLEWMGSHLRRALGRKLVILGFAFDRGGFQAVGVGAERGLRAFHVGAAPVHSLDAALARAGLPLFALDLRTLPVSGPVAGWFADRRPARSIGAIFDPVSEGFFVHQVPPSVYDGLLFVADTTAARPRFPRRADEKPRAATNLDLDAGPNGEKPAGWEVRDSGVDFDFHVATVEAGCHGKRCALIERAPGPHYGESMGGLSQRIDAAPYRGKRVRLRAWARLEPADDDTAARLLFAAVGAGMPGSANQDRFEPVRGAVWREHALELDVPADAATLTFGLQLAGNGKALLDDVTLELAPPARAAGTR